MGAFSTAMNPHTNKLSIIGFYNATFNCAKQARIIFEHECIAVKRSIKFFIPIWNSENLHIPCPNKSLCQTLNSREFESITPFTTRYLQDIVQYDLTTNKFIKVKNNQLANALSWFLTLIILCDHVLIFFMYQGAGKHSVSQ